VTGLGRFQFVQGRPIKAPGKCVTCGSSSAKDYVDFGFTVDRYGVIYICIECFTGACVELLDLVPKKHYKDSLELILEQERTIKELRDALGSIDTLRTVLGVAGISSLDSAAMAKIESTPDEISSGDNGTSTQSKSETSQSSDESGPSNIQHNDSVDDLLKLI